MKVDLHTHILPEGWPDMAARWGGTRWVRFERVDACSARMLIAGRNFRDITDQCWDPKRRLEDMERDGVERQVLSTVPVMFSYWAPAGGALELAQRLNDHIAEVVARYPARFTGLATVPLQDIDLAIGEMTRAVRDLGMPGVEVGTNVNGRNFDDPDLFRFFEAAAELGARVFVHPWEVLGRERLDKYVLAWLVGMPAETSLAIASLIFGGVLERLPSLKICFAHGGGSFHWILGRLDRGWEVNPACRAAIPRPPSAYAQRLWVDTLTHDPDALRALTGRFGIERVILGTDYPFRLGEEQAGEMVERLTDLAPAVRRRLLRDNGLDFLGLARS